MHNPASPWVAYSDESTGAHYYYNTVTDETSWDVPSDGIARVGDDDDGASSRSDASDISERSSAEEVDGEMCVLVHTAASRKARLVELEDGMSMDDILDECCVETGHPREGAHLLLGDKQVLSYKDLCTAAQRDSHGTLQCSAELVTGSHARSQKKSARAKTRPPASATTARDALGSGDRGASDGHFDRRQQQHQNNEPAKLRRVLPATKPLPPASASPYSRGQPGRGPYLRQPKDPPLVPPGRPTPPMESFEEVVAASRAKRKAVAGPGRLDEREGLPIGTIIDVEGRGQGGVVVEFQRNKFSANLHAVEFGGSIARLNLLKESWSISAPKLSPQEKLESEPGFKYEVRTEFVEAGRTGFELAENSAGLTVVRRIRPQSKAAAFPHVCEGMILLRVQGGCGAEVSTDGMSHDSIMDMMPDRPLVLIWEYPWQKQLDQMGDPHYFNTITEESSRNRPQELAGVMSAMMKWKYSKPEDPAPHVVSIQDTLDEEASGFSYEVHFAFTQSGRLGLEFKDYEGSACVTVVHSGGPAAAFPLACVGMVVARVKIGMQKERSTTGLGFDGVMDLVSTKERPLCITFTHPWQRERTEGGDLYYFNSATSESTWERPEVLDSVVTSMRAWRQSQALSPLRTVESPKPTAPKFADIESAPGFRYELRTYTDKTPFEQSGLLGFKYKNEDGAAVVRKITRMTPAASLENGCEGMVLVRVKVGTSEDMDVSSLDFESKLRLLEQRPLRLTFEHPWQKEQDDSDKPYYFNSWTGESRWDRPAELAPVVEAMREWHGVEEEPKSPSPQPSVGAQPVAQFDENKKNFMFEVRAEFTRPGRLGFEFEETDKRVRVKNVNGGSPASRQPLLCVGMFLCRIRCGNQISELCVDDLGFDHVMEMMPERPLILVFEYPWQRIADAEPYYYNSWTNESRWDRPPELDAVVAAMTSWKQQQQQQQQQQQEDEEVQEPAPMPLHNDRKAVATAKPQRGETKSQVVDDLEPGFVFQVRLSFAQQGTLGFDLDENLAGQIVIQKVKKGTPAAAEPLSCAGLVLLRITSGRLNAETDVSDGSVPFDDILDMLADRPLMLTFAHPWQAVYDGTKKSYFNSHTKKTARERPAVLDSVLEAMQAWQPQMLGSVSAKAVHNGHTSSKLKTEKSTPVRLVEDDAVVSGSVAVEQKAQIDIDLPATGSSVEVYSVGEGEWYIGRVMAHIGKTPQPGSSASDILVEYKYGTKQKILSWHGPNVRALEPLKAAGAVSKLSPALRLEPASPSPTRIKRTQTTDGIECKVIATCDKGTLRTYTVYTIQTTWGAREKMVEKRFRDIDALVSKIKILLPNSGLRPLPAKGAFKSETQVAQRTEFIQEYIPAAIRFVSSDAQEGKRLEARQHLENWLEM